MTAVRDRLANVAKLRQGSHAGLILSRYFREHDDKNVGRREVLDHARAASQEAYAVYKLAFDRWELDTRKLSSGVFRVRSRLITGLGSKGVLETGIRLHHTYGTALIPGSGLKGTAAHYCREAYGSDTQEFPLNETLFGSTGSGGHITFQDAWILPDCIAAGSREGLLPDVMTSHHPKYYSGENIPPHDSEDPNPVSFLSVRGRFRIVVECDVPNETGRKWAEFALRLVEEALDQRGAGGKTNSGYGRMTRDKKS
jgi:CRISPR-associated protein Cmr6